MGFFKSLFSAFVSGSSQQSDTQPANKYGSSFPPHVVDKSTIITGRPDSFYRLRRARSEPIEIVKLYDEYGSAADLLNKNSGNIYHVTEYGCECEDFKKNNLPCKHMIFLDLHFGRHLKYEKSVPRYYEPDTGEFIPLYWHYYSGAPTGVGYMNLYPYSVKGYLYGTSEKTGKPTKRKKTIIVHATSKDDAIVAAESSGVMAPYSSVLFLDIPPSDRQFSYLDGVKIPYPNLLTSSDASALLSRYEDSDDSACPDVLFRMATSARISVSFFSSANTVILQIWNQSSDSQKCALFCYSVYCKELSFDFGYAPLTFIDRAFSSFSPEPKQMKYILSLDCILPRKLNKHSLAYQSAMAHLHVTVPYLFRAR